MGYIYYTVQLYSKLEDEEGEWSDTPINITKTFNRKINLGIKDQKGSFEFNILNFNNEYFSTGNIFNNGDRIVISAGVNTQSLDSSDILIDGTILSIKEQMSNANILTIGGKNRTEMFLEGLCFISPATEKTPPEILEQALLFHNENNSNFQITWHPDNPSTKSDGTEFPTYKIDDFYKPMNIIFERYSSAEYTKDGNYYYYLDRDNRIVWKQMNTTLESTTPILEEDCEDITVSNKTDNIVNSLMIYCGADAYGRGIRTRAFDWSSRARNGAKWKTMTSTNSTASEVMTNEASVNSDDFSEGKSFPDSAAYPYTTSWGVSCADDEEYNKELRTRVKSLCKEKGEAYLRKLNGEPITVNLTMPFTKNYVLGGLYMVTLPKYNLSNKLLRVHNITYHDYTTMLELKEDEVEV
jgi:hypothetical protein